MPLDLRGRRGLVQVEDVKQGEMVQDVRQGRCWVRGALVAGVCLVASLPAAAQPGSAKPQQTKPDPAHHLSTGTSGTENGTQPAADATPPAPKWPINDAPNPPTIAWNSAGLKIEARNASLRQIMTQVATITGAKVQGLGADQRVFGDFGPGPAREVISQLLHGSDYNVLMLGDQGSDTPREVYLSARKTGATPSAPTALAVPDQDADQPEDVQPDQEEQSPVIIHPPTPGGPPNGPVTPQQLEDMQRQRMEQMQQQQMQMEQQNQEPQQDPQQDQTPEPEPEPQPQ